MRERGKCIPELMVKNEEGGKVQGHARQRGEGLPVAEVLFPALKMVAAATTSWRNPRAGGEE